MDEFMTKFMKPLRCMPYLKEERANKQRFLNLLPTSYKEIIEFNNLKTMDEVVRKARLCYQQFRIKSEDSKLMKGQKVPRWEGEGQDRNLTTSRILVRIIKGINLTKEMNPHLHSHIWVRKPQN